CRYPTRPCSRTWPFPRSVNDVGCNVHDSDGADQRVSQSKRFCIDNGRAGLLGSRDPQPAMGCAMAWEPPTFAEMRMDLEITAYVDKLAGDDTDTETAEAEAT